MSFFFQQSILTVDTDVIQTKPAEVTVLLEPELESLSTA